LQLDDRVLYEKRNTYERRRKCEEGIEKSVREQDKFL
jgi:hypothetical protein